MPSLGSMCKAMPHLYPPPQKKSKYRIKKKMLSPPRAQDPTEWQQSQVCASDQLKSLGKRCRMYMIKALSPWVIQHLMTQDKHTLVRTPGCRIAGRIPGATHLTLVEACISSVQKPLLAISPAHLLSTYSSHSHKSGPVPLHGAGGGGWSRASRQTVS